MPRFLLVLFAVLTIAVGTTMPARAGDPSAEPARLERTVAQLERSVEGLVAELAAVQAELAAVKRELAQVTQAAEAERLGSAAAAAAATPGAAAIDTATIFTSGERMQPQLNPELSVTGDIFLVGGGDLREELQVKGAELDLQSDLDPYTRMHVVLGAHGETAHGEEGVEDEHSHAGAEVEEAYVTWLHLPASLTLTLGKKRQQFGILNRWHMHALDQADLPWVLTESFGDHGLVGTGVSIDWLMPSLWAHVNELTVEVSNGDNETAFAGSGWERPSLVARLKSYWDLSSDAYLEVGLDAAHGAADPGGEHSSDFLALDATYNWNPAGRTVYRDVTVRGMLLRSRRELGRGDTRVAWGGYLYGQGKLSRRWIAGARVDWVDDQLAAGHRLWGVTPYLTFWQSEFVRLRGQYTYANDNVTGVDRRFVLQATFAAGPHKHESY